MTKIKDFDPGENQEYDAFVAHIQNWSAEARREAKKEIYNRDNNVIGCKDKTTKLKGRWNPPGGAIFLWQEGYLKAYLTAQKRHNNEVTLGTHMYCGYMYVELDAKTELEQQLLLSQFRVDAAELAAQIGVTIKIPSPERDGSAKPFMLHNLGQDDDGLPSDAMGMLD